MSGNYWPPGYWPKGYWSPGYWPESFTRPVFQVGVPATQIDILPVMFGEVRVGPAMQAKIYVINMPEE